MIDAQASGAAFRLVRAAGRRRLGAEPLPPVEDMPDVVSVLAALAAGFLEDAAYATGDDAERMLDVVQVRAMERAMGSA